MGIHPSKPEQRLRAIEAELNLATSILRTSTRSVDDDEIQRIAEKLVQYSTEVNSMKGRIKAKDLEAAQRKISQAIREVCESAPRESQLDLSAVETNSIVQVPTNKKSSLGRTTPDGSLKRPKGSALKQSLPTLNDIESKLKSLRPQINVALETKDKTNLRVHQETLKILATDLELIKIPDETPLSEKKKKIDSSVTAKYQKVTKALKDIRRDNNINYLEKQNKREKIMKDLEEINKDLEESDQILRLALRNEDFSSIEKMKQNLAKVNQKLSSVEIADQNTKNRKLQIVDKLTWLYKYIDEITRKGSQSDLTKAQTNYEELIKNIARGGNSDKDDLKVKLQSLQSFISTIESEDDDSIKRRKALLNNVNESLTLVDRDIPKETTDSADKKDNTLNLTEIQHFVTSWKTLQRTLRHSTTLSQVHLRDLDKILGDVQNSISKTRKNLLDVSDSNLKTSLNKSVPNLHSKPPVHDKFASSLSVDRIGEITRAKTKVYELQKVSNVNNQSDVSDRTEKRLLEIEHIRAQINYMKELFVQSSQNRQVKTKLENYVKTLEEYSKSGNQAVSNASKILLTEIQELEHVTNSSQNVVAANTGSVDIFKIHKNVEELAKAIHDFRINGGDDENETIKGMLTDNRNALTSVNVSDYNMAESQKQQTLNKIDELLGCLSKKDAYGKAAWERLNSLKEKVTRFSGAYKGVLYNQIEKDLNKLLIDTSEHVQDRAVGDDIIKGTEKYLQILEHRATKDQSFRHTLTITNSEDEQKMTNLKIDLSSIKKDIDRTPMNAVDAFIRLSSRLDLVRLGLDQLRNLNENSEHQKQILHNEVESLNNVVDAKIAVSQQSLRPWSMEEKQKVEEMQRRASADMDKIEAKLVELGGEISEFVGTKSDKKFYELDEHAIRLTLKIDNLDIPKGSELLNRKKKIIKEIQQHEDLLEQRAKETENLIQFESDIKDIENNFQRYTNSTRELETLAERIKMLQSDLESSEANQSLNKRKEICAAKTKNMTDKIKNILDDKTRNDAQLSELALKLSNIRKNIENDSSNDNNILKNFKDKLSVACISLNNMNNLDSSTSQRRDELYREIESSRQLVDIKAQNAQEQKQIDENNKRIMAELDQVKKIMKTVKVEVESFVGTMVDSKYCELDEIIGRLLGKLDVIKVGKESTLQKKRKRLLDEVHGFSVMLTKRSQETEELTKSEQGIRELERNSGTFSVMTVIEKAELMRKKLSGLDFSADFIDRKNQCLNKINELLKKCEKTKYIQANSTLSEIELAAERLRVAIDNFSGISSDKDYAELGNNLAQLTEKLSSIQPVPESETYKKQQGLLGRINLYRDTLINKSRNNQCHQDITTKLEAIKKKIDSSTNSNSLSQSQKELRQVQVDIERSEMSDKLKNDCHKKCIVLLEKYSEQVKLASSSKFIGSSAFISDVDKSTPKGSKDNDKELDVFETKIDRLREEVDKFCGNESQGAYKKLEEELLQLNLKVKKLKIAEGETNNEIKRRLKQKLVDCFTTLDDQVQQFESLEELGKEVDEVGRNLEADLTEVDKNCTDEKLISLQVKLGKLKVGKALDQKKSSMMQRILALMKKLKEKAVKSDSEDDGTLV